MKIQVGSVYLEITSRCNLSCPYCYHGHDYHGHDNDISLSSYSKLINNMAELNCYNIELSGGEPLMHPDIEQMLYVANQINVKTKLITNGTLINKLKIFNLKNVSEIAISIDGVTAGEHDGLRGKGCYKKIEESLLFLKMHNLIKQTTFSITTNRQNHLRLNEFIEFAIDWEVDGINFNELHNTPRSTSKFLKEEILEKKELLSLRNALEEYKILYKNRIKIIPNREVGGDCPLLHDDTPTTLRIDCQGNVYLCEGFCGNDYSIGNINENALPDIINSDISLEYLHFFRERINLIEKCRSCFLKNSFCYGGCVVDAYYKQADCLDTDDWCQARIEKAFRELKKI